MGYYVADDNYAQSKKNIQGSQVGAKKVTPINTLASSRIPIPSDAAPLTNRPYIHPRECRLDFRNNSFEEFPFWEITQKDPVAVDLSQNCICEWPAQTSVQKCRDLKELIVQSNYLNRLPGYIMSAYSHLTKLDLRNNQIESVPTLPKRCNILRFLEYLDLG